MGLGRVELPTSRLSGVRSNQLSYRPCIYRNSVRVCQVTGRPRVFPAPRPKARDERNLLKKGGDPAAPSDTATLLRLSASHQVYLRRLPPVKVGSPTSGTPGFHRLTGGVYKARERIHRGLLIRGY